ncbi:hypothetical protein CHARACLAT_013864 [Characodon lateralis]|uniref:Uncharacterized protein n=1 Tax=Characodon lateralis TaxID=208331 RepID=A0ABU7DIW2_9TELE|nr:hypothetical protein [Characodon lateralis]
MLAYWKQRPCNVQYSILGWASFSKNYCIHAAWHRGRQRVVLLRCNGSASCFDSGLHVICIVGSGVSSFSLQYFIDSLWVSGQASLLVNQKQNHHSDCTSFWYLWLCGQVPIPAGNLTSISIKLEGSMKCSKNSW